MMNVFKMEKPTAKSDEMDFLNYMDDYIDKTTSSIRQSNSGNLHSGEMDFLNYFDQPNDDAFHEQVCKAYDSIKSDFTVTSILNVELSDDDKLKLAYHSKAPCSTNSKEIVKLVSNLKCQDLQRSSSSSSSGSNINKFRNGCNISNCGDISVNNSYCEEEQRYYSAGCDEAMIIDESKDHICSPCSVNSIRPKPLKRSLESKEISTDTEARDKSDKGMRDFAHEQSVMALSVSEIFFHQFLNLILK